MYNFDENVPFEIKINAGNTARSEKSISLAMKTQKHLRSKKSLAGQIEDYMPDKSRLYYKSIQSKMVNPKSKKMRYHRRRASMGN